MVVIRTELEILSPSFYCALQIEKIPANMTGIFYSNNRLY